MKNTSNFKNIINFIPRFTKAILSKDTPIIAKIFSALAIFYAIAPQDLIIDVVPVLGILDDAIVLPFLIYLATKFIPEEVTEESKA